MAQIPRKAKEIKDAITTDGIKQRPLEPQCKDSKKERFD